MYLTDGRKTRNQLNRKVPWVRIPPAPPFKACKPRVCRLFSVLFTVHSIPHGVFRQLFRSPLTVVGRTLGRTDSQTAEHCISRGELGAVIEMSVDVCRR